MANVLWISTEEQSSNVLKIGVEIVAQGFIEALYLYLFMLKKSREHLPLFRQVSTAKDSLKP
jgi:hypothetical protein